MSVATAVYGAVGRTLHGGAKGRDTRAIACAFEMRASPAAVVRCTAASARVSAVHARLPLISTAAEATARSIESRCASE